jgi:exodeoxyribonuclease V beta subunit
VRSPSPPTFDIAGPLPRGMTLLEASAGTGKTFALAALVARYVAEGVRLDRLLVVTFTRMATGELRERVRDRLVSAEAALHGVLDGIPPDPCDTVVCLLADADRFTVEQRRLRLATALADFDAATIATTHGFCEHVLAGLGVLGDVESDVTFVENTDDLVDEVVDDLYVRRMLRHGDPGFSRADAGKIAAAVMADPTTAIAPERCPAGSVWDLRCKLAMGVRLHVEQRKRRAKLLTYDDLLSRLQRSLADPELGPLACARLRDRYRVALVDEFQDTDPVQWDILRRAFAHHDSTLVLIGDPKQAIYNFRGADVYAYLDAASSATTTRTLGTNWRSDQGLIQATEALFANAQLGHPQISFRSVAAAAAHRQPGLVGSGVSPPLRIRVVRRDTGDVALTAKGYVSKPSGEEYVAADLAADVAGLLSSGSRLVHGRDEVDGSGTDLVRPKDVAVLVRTNRQATRVRDALAAADVPAVVTGAGSVFATPAAQDWLRLLEALERPASTTRVRTVALGSFVGWTAEQLAGADDAELDALQGQVHAWAGVLERRGVASLLAVVGRNRHLAARLLGEAGGERQLTDLRHIGQLLHAQAAVVGSGATALASWLRRRIDEAGTDSATDERSRRLESDAEAVQVLTIHRSKGLEFAVTYVPYLWTDQSADKRLPVYHDPDDGYRRKVDVGGEGGPEIQPHQRLQDHEDRGEDLRLAYVALTRARNRVVCWWAASWGSRESPLGRLLFGRNPSGVVDDRIAPPPDAEALARLQGVAAGSHGTIGVELAGGTPTAGWPNADRATVDLDARAFPRVLDDRWRRTSYTAIAAGVHAALEPGGPTVGSEPETGGVSDELMPLVGDARSNGAGSDGPEGAEGVALPAPAGWIGWGAIPSSARTGTMVHAVLEGADFAAADLAEEVRSRVVQELDRQAVPDVPAGDLARALTAVLETPLGPLAANRALAGVPAADRINELAFELPLAGGDRPAGDAAVGVIGSLLGRRLTDADPLTGYDQLLGGWGFDQPLRGFLTGSLDLVLRVPGAPERFLVVDYKTNRLGSPVPAGHGRRGGQPQGAEDGEEASGAAALDLSPYRPATLADAMQRAHYPLQALLYLVALHRYLRWRLADYQPDRHLGGVLYLFVRGMAGPATPLVDGQPCGVFSWKPPSGLVDELSDLLDGRPW